jgi:predicted nuclease with TOPRIM domain
MLQMERLEERLEEMEELANQRAEEIAALRERAARAEGVVEARQERINAVEAERDAARMELMEFQRLPWWRRALFRP